MNESDNTPTLACSYRKLWIRDLEILLDHYKRLDRDARHLRFGGFVPDSFIDGYARQALRLSGTVIGCFIDGKLRGAGELQPIVDTWPIEAEAAFTVEQPFRGKGIGSELMRRLILTAQNRSIKTIYTICAQENMRMRRLAQKYKAELKIEHSEVAATLRTPLPTYGSLMEEWAGNAGGLLHAVLSR
ncbi:GNAT superfamily N-acetyltransferase [Rhodoligotrophos appendicifer]|uniref:GNAT family N-acetyltransferase n=1 Tax=Rhodoligotrophos appendicifer TaxID=987056 RepID=UPI00117F1A57|nr:GNAT family N-acetyltransferase [Rhodoligotrophos appendicifer]